MPCVNFLAFRVPARRRAHLSKMSHSSPSTSEERKAFEHPNSVGQVEDHTPNGQAQSGRYWATLRDKNRTDQPLERAAFRGWDSMLRPGSWVLIYQWAIQRAIRRAETETREQDIGCGSGPRHHPFIANRPHQTSLLVPHVIRPRRNAEHFQAGRRNVTDRGVRREIRDIPSCLRRFWRTL